jgi:hypothetical protein
VFGAFAAMGAINLVPGASYVALGKEGFQVCTLFVKRTPVRWSEIGQLGIYQVKSTRMVGWYWSPTSGRSSKLNAALGAPDGTLSTLFGDADELLALLEHWRSTDGLERPPRA